MSKKLADSRGWGEGHVLGVLTRNFPVTSQLKRRIKHTVQVAGTDSRYVGTTHLDKGIDLILKKMQQGLFVGFSG